jgi:hypothetical protein
LGFRIDSVSFNEKEDEDEDADDDEEDDDEDEDRLELDRDPGPASSVPCAPELSPACRAASWETASGNGLSWAVELDLPDFPPSDEEDPFASPAAARETSSGKGLLSASLGFFGLGAALEEEEVEPEVGAPFLAGADFPLCEAGGLACCEDWLCCWAQARGSSAPVPEKQAAMAAIPAMSRTLRMALLIVVDAGGRRRDAREQPSELVYSAQFRSRKAPTGRLT